MNQFKNNGQQQTGDRMPYLRSIRASTKNKVSKSSEFNIANLIEQCFEHLALLRKERIQLSCKLNGTEYDTDERSSSSSWSFGHSATVDDIVDFALEEYNEIDKLVKENANFFDTFIGVFQNTFCTFQVWFNQMQSVKFSSKKSIVKFDLDQMDTNYILNSSAESIDSNTVDSQLYMHMQQLIKCTREVRTSIWCTSVISSNQANSDLFKNSS